MFLKISNIMFTVLYLFLTSGSESARILVVIPTPSLSHQVVFRPLTQELAKRHKVVVITTDPVYINNDNPANLTEIDLHDVSYNYFRKQFKTIKMGTKSDSKTVYKQSYKYMIDVLKLQLQQPEVKRLFAEKFDLLLIESWFRPYLLFSAFWQVPVIKISSFFPMFNDYKDIGSLEHIMFYPYPCRQKIFNLTWWDTVCELYNDYNNLNVINTNEESENIMIRESLGPDVPLVSEFNQKVHMLYVNVHPIWGQNRPVPMSVTSIGGIYQNINKPLPEDLQTYLDASVQGVMYVSFGTHVIPSLLPSDKMHTIINVLSQLPYNILFRWDQDTMPGKSDNIKIAKWFPQTDVLRHPNVKLFVTQGGLQSTEEAIRSSVPLLGLPMFLDHWYNSEKYVHHGIGLKLEFESLTEEQLTTAIYGILNGSRYRENLLKLRSILDDQRMPALKRAVWWTEHVLTHGGRHLRAPAAGIGLAEYLELELLLLLLGFLVLTFGVIYAVVRILLKYLKSLLNVNTL